MNKPEKNKNASNIVVRDFVKTLLFPMLVNKAFMLYFGLNYSSNPGQGYGYGLVLTVVVLFTTIGVFLWKYKDIEDP